MEQLSGASVATQKHAACALWVLSDGKEGVYDKEMVQLGAVPKLVALLELNHEETRGFAAACLAWLGWNKRPTKDAEVELFEHRVRLGSIGHMCAAHHKHVCGALAAVVITHGNALGLGHSLLGLSCHQPMHACPAAR